MTHVRGLHQYWLDRARVRGSVDNDLNLGGTFYFLISVLDGYGRSIVHWEISESMRKQEVELERWHGCTSRLIT